MAEVYKAYQPGLNRYVGIKVLHSHMVGEENFVARFEREALSVGKLRHPNIVQVFDFDREGEIYFMAMEFIDGPTLKDELEARHTAGQPFNLNEIARIFIALCSAIDYAHARGMVHRDLKPANVMINREGQVVLTDFGITRIMGGTTFTKTGALSGTPAYMSPEQGQGQHGDERSDIYSLGVMLYEIATGAVPYDADTPFVIILKHISEPVPPPRKIAPHLPASVEQIILKAMRKEPAERYQNAGELALALRQAVGLAPGQEHLPLPVLAPRPEVQEIDHSTERFRAKQTPQLVVQPGGATMAAPQKATAIESPPVKRKSLAPLLIGGALLLILILVGVAAGAFLFSRGQASTAETPQPAINDGATGTAVAEMAAAETAEAIVNATGTALAEETAAAASGPTQTALAATAIVEATVAQQTREAEIIAGILSAQAGTATAAAIEAATATAIAQQIIATQTAAAEATGQAAEAQAAAGRSATETAEAQAAQTAQAQATAIAQDQAEQAARAEAQAPRGTFNDFETASTWRRGDEPNGTFERSTVDAYTGDYAGKLDYRFSTPNNDYVVFLWSQALGGRPNQITAWVNGDGAGHFLNLWVRDSAGETWQFSFGQIKHTGWQQMRALISPDQPWPAGHIDGPGNSAVDYPLSFQALVLDDGSDDFSGSGTIYIDDLSGAEGALPPTPVPIGSPNILFQAEQTVLNAGDCTVLSWSVENVNAVYLDGAPVTGQDSRQICPNATTTYTLRVIKKDGSSSDVPLTITIQ
jgi:hypothetical protein